jgi:O-antigen ligase
MILAIGITMIFNIDKTKKENLFFNYLFILFTYGFFQSYFSIYINTSFEINQQQLISLTFLLYIIYYKLHKSEKYSMENFLNLVLLISYIIFTAIIIDYATNYLTMDTYTVKMSILKYFKNVRVLNHIQTIIIPSTVVYLLINKTTTKRFLIVNVLIINFILLLYTGARGTLYSIEVVFIFIFFTNFRNKTSRDIILRTHMYFVIAIIIYVAMQSTFGDGHSAHLSDISSDGRMFIYKTILPTIINQNYFINAIGFSSQDLAITHYLHPHNIFLYTFLGTGTLGLITFIIFSIYIIYESLKQYKNKNIKDKYLYMIFVAPLIHSLVSGIYITPLTSLLYIYFLFIFLKKYTINVIEFQSNTKFNQIANIFIISVTILLSGLLIKENILQKNIYQYNKSEKKKLYHPGIMLYSDKIYTRGEKH